MFALSEFDIRYQPARAVKGQAIADHIADVANTATTMVEVRAWAMFFDRSVCDMGCGIGVLLVSPRGQHIHSPSGSQNHTQTTWWNTKPSEKGWNFSLKLEQKQWKYLGI